MTVIDSVRPVVVCQDLTVYLDGTGAATITAADVDNGSTDNCATPTLGIDVSTFSCANIGANTVVLTATDDYGNASNCSATITVLDSISPVASCNDVTTYLDAAGNVSITAGDVDNGSVDNCGVSSLALSTSAFTCANIGSNTVNLTVSDAQGNTDVCSATITIIDSVAPTALCNGLTVHLDGTGSATITTGDIDNGSVDNCSISSYSISTSTFTCADIGTNTVTLTVTDIASNTATCDATVTVIDSVTPIAICQDLTVYLDGSGAASIVAADIDGGSSDNCGTPTLSASTTSFTCAEIGTNSVTLTVTDASGNQATCVATVTVADSTSPVALCQDLTVYVDGSGTASIVAADIDGGSSDNCSTPALTASTTSFTCAEIGTNSVTLTVTDASGNLASCVSTVTVLDTLAPTASNIDTTFAECIGDVAIDITLVSDEADNCTTTPIVTHVGDVASNGTGCNDTIVRTYNVADDSGNNMDVTQIIILNDTTLPTASNPNPISVTCLADVPSPSPSWVTDEADNCGAPIVTHLGDVSSNGTGCNDTITRTFEVADACGNAITVEQVIIVNDDVAPVADNLTLSDFTGFCDLTPTTPTATDNCGTVINGVADATFPLNATTLVTWTFTDACGNAITQTQNVIIESIDVSTTVDVDGITIIASNIEAGVTYEWLDCDEDTLITGETNQNFTPTYNGDFAVIVSQDGCSDTSACVLINEVGIEQLNNVFITLYPNPTKGVFTIDYDGNVEKVEMFDVLGRLVLTQTSFTEGVVDASQLAPGKYMVRIETGTNQTAIEPIVIRQN